MFDGCFHWAIRGELPRRGPHVNILAFRLHPIEIIKPARGQFLNSLISIQLTIAAMPRSQRDDCIVVSKFPSETSKVQFSLIITARLSIFHDRIKDLHLHSGLQLGRMETTACVHD